MLEFLRVFRDDAVGETRWVRARDGRPDALILTPWPEAEGREANPLRVGALALGRLASIDPVAGGGFVDLGRDGDGFLPFKTGKPHKGLSEGAHIVVEVAADAYDDKRARLRRRVDRDPPDGAGLGVFEAAPSPDALWGADADAVETGAAAREAADQALEEALAPAIALPGGARLNLARAAAGVLVDVDTAGGQRGLSDPGRKRAAVNRVALAETARQMALRSWAGLAVVDPAGAEKADPALIARFGEALKRHALAHDKIEASGKGPMLTRIARTHAPVEAQRLIGGAARADALAGLRELERAAIADRGGRLRLRLAPDAAAWLAGAPFDAAAALAERFGARLSVAADGGLRPGAFDVDPVEAAASVAGG